MAWTTPKTWTVGEVLTAANMNAQVRDNEVFLSTPPGCRLRHSANFPVPNNAFTAIPFDTEDYDTNSMHDLVTNNTRITANTAGKYLIIGGAQIAANATGERALRILFNGATVIAQMETANNGAAGCELEVSAVITMAVNDYVELQAYQISTIALNVNSLASHSPIFHAAWQGF